MPVIKRVCYDKVSERCDFMETFIIFVVGSIILSVVADRVNDYRIFKDLADAGYKLNLDKLMEITKDIKTNDDVYNNQGVGIKKRPNTNSDYSKSVKKVAMFIPWFNIYTVYKNIKAYNEARARTFEYFNFLGVLEEMTLEEKERYAKHPNGYVAYRICLFPTPKSVKNKIIVLTYKDNNGTSKIIYEIRDNLEDIHVLEVTGSMEEIWKKAENKDLENKLKKILLGGIDKYEGLEKFIEAVNSGMEDKKSNNGTELTIVIDDTFTYFQKEERLREEKRGVAKEIIDLNQEIDATLFKVLNELDKDTEKKVITYPINNIVWNVSFTKVSGSLGDYPYSMQWKLIALVLRKAVIDTIRNWENSPEFTNHLNNEIELNFEYEVGNESNCIFKVTAKYNHLENKQIQEEFKKKVEKAALEKEESPVKFADTLGTDELYQEENTSDIAIDSENARKENQNVEEGPKLVRKPKSK